MTTRSLHEYKEVPAFIDSFRGSQRPLHLKVPQANLSAWDQEQTETTTSNDGERSDILKKTLASKSSVVFLEDEDEFKSLAVVWRLINDGQTLSLHLISATHNNSRELHIDFLYPVDKDCTCIFSVGNRLFGLALSRKNVLYDLDFSIDDLSAIEDMASLDSLENIFRQQDVSLFGLREAFYFYPLSPKSFVVSLKDGGLALLSRSDLRAPFESQVFNDSSYIASLSRRLIPWSMSDRVPNHPKISSNLVLSMEHIGHFLVTVSINMSLKCWNLHTLDQIGEYTLINDTPTPNRKYFLEYSQTRYISSVTSQFGNTFLVTFSPLGDGKIKLWRFSHENGKAALEDLHHDDCITLQVPDEHSVWKVADMRLRPANGKSISLWILWKSSTSSSVAELVFQPDSLENVNSSTWRFSSGQRWRKSFIPDAHSGTSSESISDYYAEKLFRPDYIARNVIETALPIYLKHFYPNSKKISGFESMSLATLKRTIAQVVGAAVTIRPGNSLETSDFESYNRDLALQWSRFERLCLELGKTGNEALSLAVSPSGQIWIMKASSLSILRKATIIESLYENNSNSSILSSKGIKYERASMSMYLILQFLRSLESRILLQLVESISRDALEEPVFGPEERMWNILDATLGSDFSSQPLVDLLDSLQELSTLKESLTVILEASLSNHLWDGSKLIPGTFPLRFISNGVFEVSFNYCELLCAILIFLIVYDDSIPDLSTEDACFFYSSFLNVLRNYLCFCKMTTTLVITDGENGTSAEDSLVKQVQGLQMKESDGQQFQIHNATVLDFLVSEISFPSDISDLTDAVATSLSKIGLSVDLALTESIAKVIAKRSSNSIELLPYLSPCLAVAAYVEARAYMLSEQYSVAGLLIRKIALELSDDQQGKDQLSCIKSLDQLPPPRDELPVLYPDLFVEGSLAKGLPAFYRHAASLFSYYSQYSLAAEFASLAAMELTDDPEELKKSNILLFYTGIYCSDYDKAYTAFLLLGPDSAPEAISVFVEQVCNKGVAKRLLQYPFIGFQKAVDECLQRKALDASARDSKVSIYKVLYCWRLKHGDYRAAAEALYLRLCYLRNAVTVQDEFSVDEVDITNGYLTLINVLSCIDDPKDAWVFGPSWHRSKHDDEVSKRHKSQLQLADRSTRRIFTLQDIKEEYQRELDRMQLLLGQQLLKMI